MEKIVDKELFQIFSDAKIPVSQFCWQPPWEDARAFVLPDTAKKLEVMSRNLSVTHCGSVKESRRSSGITVTTQSSQ